MHHKHKSPKGHKNQRNRILKFLANWASEMSFHQGFVEHQLLLDTLKFVFLESDCANDRDQRMEVLHLFSQMETLLKGLGKFEPEDFKEIDKWLLLNLE